MEIDVKWPDINSELREFVNKEYGSYRIVTNYGSKMVLKVKDSFIKISRGDMSMEPIMTLEAKNRGVCTPNIRDYKRILIGDIRYDILVVEEVQGRQLTEEDMNWEIRSRIIEEMGKIAGDSEDFIYFTPGFDKGYRRYDSVKEFFMSRINERDEDNRLRLTSLFERCNNIDKMDEASFFHHGDLHPSNIILKKDNSLCFLDWGAAGYYPIKYIHTLDKLFDWGVYNVDNHWASFEKDLRNIVSF